MSEEQRRSDVIATVKIRLVWLSAIACEPARAERFCDPALDATNDYYSRYGVCNQLDIINSTGLLRYHAAAVVRAFIDGKPDQLVEAMATFKSEATSPDQMFPFSEQEAEDFIDELFANFDAPVLV